MWVLLGIAVIVAGFLLRFHPLLVILASAIVTGLAAGLDPLTILAAFGKAFNEARYVSIIWSSACWKPMACRNGHGG